MKLAGDVCHLRPVEKFVLNEGYAINAQGIDWTYALLKSLPGCTWSIRTLRNAGCHLQALGLIEGYQSGCGFFRVKGSPDHRITKVKPDRMGVSLLLSQLPQGEEQVHNVRLAFYAPQLYERLLARGWTPGERNLDIVLNPQKFDKDRIAKVRVHRTGNATVLVACSTNPFRSTALTEFFCLLDKVKDALEYEYFSEPLRLPTVGLWMVVGWEHGIDGKHSFEGDSFSMTFETWSGVLARFYAKDVGNGLRRPRLEVVESPRRPLEEAVQQLLAAGSRPEVSL